jgi:hypothetical protein
MNINRHNYEDFFILYLDNELNLQEKKAVEDFLLINPDLEREMSALRQTIFTPDTNLVFTGKEQLMMVDSSHINVYNYEMFLVQYMDGELSPGEITELEKFIALNPAIQQELNRLKKTRSAPDATVVFGDKTSLYRHEKVHHIYSLRWLKQAAAAAVILTVGAGIFMLSDNKSTDIDSIVTVAETTEKAPQQIIEQSTSQGNNNEIVPAQSESGKPSPALKETIENKQVPVQFASINQSNKKVPINHSVNVAATELTDLEKPLDVPVRLKNISTADENVYANLQQQNINEDAVTNKFPVRTTTEASPGIVQPMYVVDVADVEPENKRIRGFFRKATRILERTTNIAAANDDDKLLVGGFAINLK